MIRRHGRSVSMQHLAGRVLAAVVPLTLVSGAAFAEEQFEKALVYLERNVADDDLEVKFVATSSELGFAALRVIAPDGRTVIDFKSPDSRLGIRKLDLESPEPRGDGSVTADFPEGKYSFEGTLVGGATVRAEATLRHALPAAPVLSVPRADQAELPAKGAKVRWEPAADVASWEVTLKEKQGAREMRATLPAASTSFAVPDGFLVGGTNYKLSVGAIQQGGNRSYQEIEFTAHKR